MYIVSRCSGEKDVPVVSEAYVVQINGRWPGALQTGGTNSFPPAGREIAFAWLASSPLEHQTPRFCPPGG